MNASIPPGLLEPEIALEAPVSTTNLSQVWKGVRRNGGGEVAVKFALSPAAAAMLAPEAETVRMLEAAGVAGIVPAEFSALPVPHVVFPWRGERTLRNILDAARTGDDRARAAALLIEVVHIVAQVQRQGVLHGDLKPENILVDDRGRPWLTDFGMARAVHDARLDSAVSQSMSVDEGGWGGTLPYLPPEGLKGESPAASWDVYALGVMLHELLLGKRPDRAASPDSLKGLLSSAIVDVLLGALAFSPERRFPNVPSLAAALDPIEEELTLTGRGRVAIRAMRLGIAGLASFFVALRYTSVIALLGVYIATAILALRNPQFLLAYLPFAIAHAFVRWEGPETSDEVAARRLGQVLGQNRDPRGGRPVGRTRGEARRG